MSGYAVGTMTSGTWTLPGTHETLDLVGRLLFGVDQDHVGAGLLIGGRALQRLFLAEAGDQRLGAGDDEEVRVAAGRARGFDLALEFLDAHQLLAPVGEQAGDLRKGLVLDDDGGGAGALVSRTAWMTLIALP